MYEYSYLQAFYVLFSCRTQVQVLVLTLRCSSLTENEIIQQYEYTRITISVFATLSSHKCWPAADVILADQFAPVLRGFEGWWTWMSVTEPVRSAIRDLRMSWHSWLEVHMTSTTVQECGLVYDTRKECLVSTYIQMIWWYEYRDSVALPPAAPRRPPAAARRAPNPRRSRALRCWRQRRTQSLRNGIGPLSLLWAEWAIASEWMSGQLDAPLRTGGCFRMARSASVGCTRKRAGSSTRSAMRRCRCSVRSSCAFEYE